MTEIQNVSGKLLRVNLSNKEISTEIIKKELFEKFLGGRGLGAYYLMNEISPDTNPYSSNNKLIFMNGPLSGTLIPGNNKICVTFKSPLTETYSYSLCGGHWGPEMKYAGFDGLIIEGKSKDPVFLWIDDEEIDLKSANHIWGNLIPESEMKIRSDLGDDATIQIAVIGVAGERRVRYACITADKYREFGRGGAGAVMGSKNLKGIAIRGTQDVQVAEPDEIIQFSTLISGRLPQFFTSTPGLPELQTTT
ncbi:MAG: aldehyde ferredoxin oxidoreductase N-terminal domain-containing protein [Promethearchaeia archaeon]